MNAADAVEHAKAALSRADEAAEEGLDELATGHVAVADGWTRLAATLAQHLEAATTDVHVRVDAAACRFVDEVRRAARVASSKSDWRLI